MRLLNVNTKLLEEFIGDEAGTVPPYAILSHTWGRNEVTFKVIEGRGYQSGSIKIDGCCKQAIDDRLGYVWIDTCCIDKSSSAELSEAINSMFNWYLGAEVCYAYLSDVHPESRNHWNKGSHFRTSRWFTRGWTLQELVAPAELNFYDSAWGFLGTKESNIFLVRQITGIPDSVLTGDKRFNNLERASIAQKMSWAANRTTTRTEDVAYSLLGIFGVNMPLLYGEGSRAFTRLQEEIIKNSNDESIFAWGLLQPPTERLSTNLLFASSPRDFENCGDIVPFTPQGVNTSHYSLTNKGLHMKIALCKICTSGGGWIGRLNCSLSEEKSKSIALPLSQLPGDTNSFCRTGMPVLVASELFPQTAGDSPNFYLQKTLPLTLNAFYSGFSISLWRFGVPAAVESTEIYPPLWRGILGQPYKELVWLDSRNMLDSQQQTIIFQCSFHYTSPSFAIKINYTYSQVSDNLGIGRILGELVPEEFCCKAAIIPAGKSLAEWMVDTSRSESNADFGALEWWKETLDFDDGGSKCQLMFSVETTLSESKGGNIGGWVTDVQIIIKEAALMPFF